MKDASIIEETVVHYRRHGTVYSVYPPTAYLTFGYWMLCVPPFKPDSVLMLGYAGGTIAGLIRLLYGDVEITAVDKEFIDDRYGVRFVSGNAPVFAARVANTYQCVIIDLYNGQDTPKFVEDPSFVENIARITDEFLVVYCSKDINIGIYDQHFRRLRMIETGTHRIAYYAQHSSTRQYFPW